MERVYQEAFTEIDEIFKIMPIDLLSKIPANFRKIISDNKAMDYNVKIQEPLDEKNLKKETVVILGLVYRDFIASPEERERLKLRDEEELKRIEREMQEQYDIENIFDKRKAKNRQRQMEESEDYFTDLVVYKEPGIISRFFSFIKNIFKRDKF